MSEGDGDDVWRVSLVFVGLRGSKEKIVPLFPLPALQAMKISIKTRSAR